MLKLSIELLCKQGTGARFRVAAAVTQISRSVEGLELVRLHRRLVLVQVAERVLRAVVVRVVVRVDGLRRARVSRAFALTVRAAPRAPVETFSSETLRCRFLSARRACAAREGTTRTTFGTSRYRRASRGVSSRARRVGAREYPPMTPRLSAQHN